MAGVPLKAVQELLGHATMEMTLRYAHLSPEVRRRAVKTLDRAPTTVAEHSGAHKASTGTSAGIGTSAGEAKYPVQHLIAVPSPAPLAAGEITDGARHV